MNLISELRKRAKKASIEAAVRYNRGLFGDASEKRGEALGIHNAITLIETARQEAEKEIDNPDLRWHLVHPKFIERETAKSILNKYFGEPEEGKT